MRRPELIVELRSLSDGKWLLKRLDAAEAAGVVCESRQEARRVSDELGASLGLRRTVFVVTTHGGMTIERLTYTEGGARSSERH